jgi:formylglycine-generating enzyme required for sulfatase activity
MINSALYEKIVALDAGIHRNLKFDAARCNFEFSRKYTAIPLTGREFVHAAREYAIVFMRGDDRLFRPVVLLGFSENLYVNMAGLWEANYLPVLVQHYPFVIEAGGASSGGSIDEQCAGLNFENGKLLIDAEGVWQPVLNAELQFLHEYQKQLADTEQMVKQWDELGLFVSSDACLSFPGGEAFELRDFYVVDEALFNQLSADVLPALFQSGAIKLIYQHLDSLIHLPRLLNLAAVRAAENQQKLNTVKKAPIQEGVFARKMDAPRPMLKVRPVEEQTVQDDQRKQEVLKKLAEEKIRVAREHRARYAQGEVDIPAEEAVSESPLEAQVDPQFEPQTFSEELPPAPVEAMDWKKTVPVWLWGLLIIAILVLIWIVRGVHDKVPASVQAPVVELPVAQPVADAHAHANLHAYPVEMVRIEAGSFEMGSSNGDPDEKPVQRIKIAHSFEIAKTEVTQGLWKSVMGQLPASLYFKNCGDQCPVDSVSWNEAQEFIAKLNAKSGNKYRLPTEAEWEYACRAGGKNTYCGSDSPASVAWYGNKQIGSAPHPVATKAANAWGVYDMSGNVWEWVEDCYRKHYRSEEVDGNARCERVLRGGSWSNDADTPRAANRYKRAAGERLNNNGFRLARSL